QLRTLPSPNILRPPCRRPRSTMRKIAMRAANPPSPLKTPGHRRRREAAGGVGSVALLDESTSSRLRYLAAIREARCRLAPASFEEAQRAAGEDGRAAREHGFVDHHAAGMNAAATRPIRAFGGDAEEGHRAGDFLQHIGEILRPHDRA